MAIFKFKRDTSSKWSQSTVKLQDGEIGWDKTNKFFKIGNGLSLWDTLAWPLGKTITQWKELFDLKGALDAAGSIATTANTNASLALTKVDNSRYYSESEFGYLLENNGEKQHPYFYIDVDPLDPAYGLGAYKLKYGYVMYYGNFNKYVASKDLAYSNTYKLINFGFSGFGFPLNDPQLAVENSGSQLTLYQHYGIDYTESISTEGRTNYVAFVSNPFPNAYRPELAGETAPKFDFIKIDRDNNTGRVTTLVLSYTYKGILFKSEGFIYNGWVRRIKDSRFTSDYTARTGLGAVPTSAGMLLFTFGNNYGQAVTQNSRLVNGFYSSSVSLLHAMFGVYNPDELMSTVFHSQIHPHTVVDTYFSAWVLAIPPLTYRVKFPNSFSDDTNAANSHNSNEIHYIVIPCRKVGVNGVTNSTLLTSTAEASKDTLANSISIYNSEIYRSGLQNFINETNGIYNYSLPLFRITCKINYRSESASYAQEVWVDQVYSNPGELRADGDITLINKLSAKGGVDVYNADITRASLVNASEKVVNLGTINSGTISCNLSLGSVFKLTLNSTNSGISLLNTPPAGTAYGFTLVITNTSGQVPLYSQLGTIKYPLGTPPTITPAGTDVLYIETFGDGVWIISQLMEDLK